MSGSSVVTVGATTVMGVYGGGVAVCGPDLNLQRRWTIATGNGDVGLVWDCETAIRVARAILEVAGAQIADFANEPKDGGA